MSSLTFAGDLAVVNYWYPFAVSQLKVLRATGNTNQTLMPVSGVTIQLSVVPDHIHIVAQGNVFYGMTSDDFRPTLIRGLLHGGFYYTLGVYRHVGLHPDSVLVKWTLDLHIIKQVFIQVIPSTHIWTYEQTALSLTPAMTAMTVDNKGDLIVCGKGDRIIDDPVNFPFDQTLDGVMVKLDTDLNQLKRSRFAVSNPDTLQGFEPFNDRVEFEDVVVDTNNDYYVCGSISSDRFNDYPGGGVVRGCVIKMTSDFQILSEHTNDRFIGYESMVLSDNRLYTVGAGTQDAFGPYVATYWTVPAMTDLNVQFGTEQTLNLSRVPYLWDITASPTHIYGLGYQEIDHHENAGIYTHQKLLVYRFDLSLQLQMVKVMEPFTMSGRHFGTRPNLTYDTASDSVWVASNHGTNTIDVLGQTADQAYAAQSLILQLSADLEVVNYHGFDTGLNATFTDVQVDAGRLYITGRIRQNPVSFSAIIAAGDDVGTVVRWDTLLYGENTIAGTHDGLTVTPSRDARLTLVDALPIAVLTSSEDATQTDLLTVIDGVFGVNDDTDNARDGLRPHGGSIH